MKNMFRTLSCFVLVFSFMGCASAQVLHSIEPHVRLSSSGLIFVGEKVTGLSKLAAELKKADIPLKTQILVEIPPETPSTALSAIGRELASNGYRRFVFNKPRKIVTEKGQDPLLNKLQ